MVAMPRWRTVIPVDDYVIDVLLRDITGHDKQPAAFLVYLWLYGQAARRRWRPVAGGLGAIAEATGLSRSAVQSAMARLRARELIVTRRARRTATPEHRVRRHWREESPSAAG
jgi:DNA-binding MarR family transcriptional regulator